MTILFNLQLPLYSSVLRWFHVSQPVLLSNFLPPTFIQENGLTKSTVLDVEIKSRLHYIQYI